MTFVQLLNSDLERVLKKTSLCNLCSLQLLPLLASALEFGSAAAPALNPLLKIGSWLPQDEFNVKVGVNDVVSSYNMLIVSNLIVI